MFYSLINNTRVYNTKDFDAVMPRYSFIEYSDNFSKKSESSCQHCGDKLALKDSGIIHFANIYATLNLKRK